MIQVCSYSEMMMMMITTARVVPVNVNCFGAPSNTTSSDSDQAYIRFCYAMQPGHSVIFSLFFTSYVSIDFTCCPQVFLFVSLHMFTECLLCTSNFSNKFTVFICFLTDCVVGFFTVHPWYFCFNFIFLRNHNSTVVRCVWAWLFIVQVPHSFNCKGF